MLDPPSKFPDNHAHFSDHLLRTSDRYDDIYGPLSRKASDDSGNYRSWNGSKGVFAAQIKMVDDEETGVWSPPLWRSSPSRSPQYRQNHYRSLSPSSRSQAIARGQRELMEMVSRMPEGCYELSLKDLVEQPTLEDKQGSFSKDRGINVEEVVYSREKTENKIKKVQMSRSGSLDNGGFLLKMVFPISWGSRKKQKKSNSGMNSSSKDGRVSPRPLLSNLSTKSPDKEWWKKEFSEEGESESGRLSSNSGSSQSTGSRGSRNSRLNSSRHRSGGCWSFIFSGKDKTAR